MPKNKKKKDKSQKLFEKFFYSQEGITKEHYNSENAIYKAQKRCWDYVLDNFELYKKD